MNQIEIFNSPEFGSIRTLEQNGKVLFCGTDVATALGYTNPRKAVRDHTRGGTKCSIGVQTGKKADGSPAVQMVEMLFIPEGDLYRLIAHSKLPSAERFEQWVFDEVLPAIRKHGAYLTKEKLWEIATSPEALIKLCSELLAEREENASLREENALLESKAAFYDLFIDLNHSTNLRTTAKELLVPERRFVRFLLEKRFVYRTASGNVLPYFEKLETGYMDVIRDSIENRADDVCRAKEELRTTPVYPHSAAYAREHGELEQYRASNNANLQCKESIEAAVREHFDGMYLSHDAAKGVIEIYGMERVAMVLANTVQLQDWDGRYSRRNKEWAKTIPNDNPETVRCGYALNSHPAVLDGFIDLVRVEQQRSRTQGEKLQPSRPSVRDKLKQELPAHKPAAPKKREPER